MRCIADTADIVRAAVLSLLLVILQGVTAMAEEAVPDPVETRAHITRLVAAATAAKHPATLGLLHDAVDLSIGYGAPAYNAGDHAACGDFYAATAAQLVAAFPVAADAANGTAKATVATSEARRALAGLQAAVVRAAGIADPDRKAWTMRFGFDQIAIAVAASGHHAQLLAESAGQYFRRGDYEEAELGYAAACERAAEIAGEDDAGTDVQVRIAALLRGQAQLALGHMAEAAASVAKGILLVPELAKADFDLHAIYGNGIELDQSILDLSAFVDQHATDADALFLLGFEQRFTGRKDAAERSFARVLTLAPTHAGARLLGGVADAGAGHPAGGADSVP